jgi:hypothetical protein
MTDKTFSRFLFIIAALFLAWYLWHRKNAAVVAPDGTMIQSGSNDPMLLAYAANPSRFDPPTVNGMVNINVNGAAGLNQNYMPLFGFVGMAQGEIFQ